VESLGGSVEVASEPGAGTTVTLLLPVTLALLRVLLVERGGQMLALPLASVQEARPVDRRMSLGGRAALELRGRSVPLADLAASLGAEAPPLPERPIAIVVTSGGDTVAAMCDRVVAEQEVVVKPLGPVLA